MAACAYCGAETQLYDNGVPVCLKCSEEREAKRKPPVPSTEKGSITDATFEIEFLDPGVEAFSFTFGQLSSQFRKRRLKNEQHSPENSDEY